jgi:hypothetical protein
MRGREGKRKGYEMMKEEGRIGGGGREDCGGETEEEKTKKEKEMGERVER